MLAWIILDAAFAAGALEGLLLLRRLRRLEDAVDVHDELLAELLGDELDHLSDSPFAASLHLIIGGLA